MTLSVDLASGATDLGSWTPEELLAGDAPVVTDYAPVTTDGVTSYAKFEVIALKADGSIGKYDPAGVAPLNVAVGILTQPIKVSQTLASAPYFAAGYFNHAILTWPAAQSTLVLRKAVFVRTPIFIGALSN
jgi:hypothetical protein